MPSGINDRTHSFIPRKIFEPAPTLTGRLIAGLLRVRDIGESLLCRNVELVGVSHWQRN
ncbi:hypothetical protein NOCA1130411 [metagenome]|uniref:Uncharacterized protein n=1 Tax=metagenome TaxID=256318 RepID=A0A2P2C016_9ZZZZ